MAYEVRENTGSLFVNERKEANGQPDRTGSAKIGGLEYWVSGWLKESKDGKKWLSLSFTAKDKLRKLAGAQDAEPVTEIDDEIPF